MKKIILSDPFLNDISAMYPVFDLIKNGIVLTNSSSKILYVNPFYTEITGYGKEDVIGQNPGMLRSGYHDESFYKTMWKTLTNTGFWQGEIWNRKRSGQIYPSLLTITKLQNKSNNLVNYFGNFSDITFLEEDNVEKLNLAFYDPLTKLPNRLALEEHFKRIVNGYERKHCTDAQSKVDTKIAIVFFDLNKFKLVNDTYGHVVGDKLLKMIADRLKELTRGSDIIARFGGDEFVAVVPDIHSAEDVKSYCARLTDIFTAEFNINGIIINSSCSIGVSIYPDDTCRFEGLIALADKAMYLAKEKWRLSHDAKS